MSNQKLKDKLGAGWYEKLSDEFEKPYLQDLGKWLAAQRQEVYIYPAADEIFTAFKLTQPGDVKVVFLGEEPYPTYNTAHGLAFSSKDPLNFPPLLNTILTEIESDVYNGLSLGLFECPDLTRWSRQGVFLLNVVLTVEKDLPGSHADKGWETFTGRVINEINKIDRPIVWIISNDKAYDSYRAWIPTLNKKHIVLLRKGCFSKANEFLKNNGLTEIEW